jgi:hypothetical protein
MRLRYSVASSSLPSGTERNGADDYEDKGRGGEDQRRRDRVQIIWRAVMHRASIGLSS